MTTATYIKIEPRLYIRVRGEAKSWAFRFTIKGKTKEKLFGSACGLGKAQLSKADAIMQKRRWDGMLAAGQNPFAKVVTGKMLTFAQVVAEIIQTNTTGKKRWAVDAKGRCGTAYDWEHMVEECPELAAMRFDDPRIDDQVVEELRKFWGDKKGEDYRARIGKAFKFAKALRIYFGENPADVERINTLLGEGRDARPQEEGGDVKHHESLPYAEVPAAIAALQAKPLEDPRSTENAAATEFLILTHVRSSNVRFCSKAAIDRQARTWTIAGQGHTGQRMKAGVKHVVQLSDRAMEIINERWDRAGDLLFQGKDGQPISDTFARDMIGTPKVKGIGLAGKATPHGFRRSFGDRVKAVHPQWWPFANAMLAHMEGKRDSNVTKAYFSERNAPSIERFLTQDWTDHCMGRATKASLKLVVDNEITQAAA